MRKGVVERQGKPLLECSRKVEKGVEMPVDERLNWAMQDFDKWDVSSDAEGHGRKGSKIHHIPRIHMILSYMLG